ncbi:MAG: hypothetical protein JWR70_800 [Modestobacter sp.]|nr:hypothetical protein [Modestobacter sp.]
MSSVSTIPLVSPRSGTPGRELAAVLRHVLNKAMNVPMPDSSPVTDYVLWGTDAVTALNPWLSSEDVDGRIRTPTY